MFELDDAVAVLESTPTVLQHWLGGLGIGLTEASEGPGTFSPFDVMGHLIQGELHDWLPRVKHIVDGRSDEPFLPFDRIAMLEATRGRTIDELLGEFADRRAENVDALLGLELAQGDFCRPGLHPELGRVTLGELLATWVVHDLSHIGQIARVMASRYCNEVGPWTSYLPILGSR